MKQHFRVMNKYTIIGLLFLLWTIPVFGDLGRDGKHLFSVRDFGAKGDGATDDAVAIQEAIDACAKAGGGQVIFPAPYTYLASPIQLRSNMELRIEGGAKLLANPDEAVYKKSAFRDNVGEGTLWLWGEDIHNLSLSGNGEIDGNGISFMGTELEDSYELKPFDVTDPRPHVLTIIGGSNIRIRDLKIGNSAYWTVHLIGCNDVVINGITLLNSLKVRNSDGIDLDHSRNVRISDCYIESGDDCICLKNRREYDEFGPCENIVVTNCTMTSRSCAIKIGSENVDTIRQVLFDNCIIKDSNRGVGIQNRDEGIVSDVTFSNMLIMGHLFSNVWWGKAEPIYVTAYRRASIDHKDANWRFPKDIKEGRVGEVKNIRFSNIRCLSENGVFVSAESADKIQGIVFDGVELTIQKITSLAGGVYDRRPAEVAGFVEGSTAGFYFDTATGITIRNSSVSWGTNKAAYFGSALESYRVEGLNAEGLAGTAALEGLPAQKIEP